MCIRDSRATYPKLTAPQVRSIIEKSADDVDKSGGYDIHYGWGRVNVGNALAAASRK